MIVQWGDVATWVAAVVGIIAMIVAIVQARGASESGKVADRKAKAAESSAEAAERSAGAAERAVSAAEDQANATKEQVEILRQQLQAQDADRHQRAAPQFVMEWIPAMGSYSGSTEQFWVSYRDGPPTLDRVVISLPRDSDVAELRGTSEDGQPVATVEFQRVSRGRRNAYFATTGTPGGMEILFSVAAESGPIQWDAQPVRAVQRGSLD